MSLFLFQAAGGIFSDSSCQSAASAGCSFESTSGFPSVRGIAAGGGAWGTRQACAAGALESEPRPSAKSVLIRPSDAGVILDSVR